MNENVRVEDSIIQKVVENKREKKWRLPSTSPKLLELHGEDIYALLMQSPLKEGYKLLQHLDLLQISQ